MTSLLSCSSTAARFSPAHQSPSSSVTARFQKQGARLSYGGRLQKFSVRAKSNDRENDNAASSGSSMDWDSAWSNIRTGLKEKMNVDLDMEQYVTRKPPVRITDRVSAKQVEKIKEDERRLLNVWSSTDFTKFGYISIAVIFVFMVFIIGPPPS